MRFNDFKEGGGARSDQKERDRIFINVRAPNFAGKVSDENLKVNQKNRASEARSVFCISLNFSEDTFPAKRGEIEIHPR